MWGYLPLFSTSVCFSSVLLACPFLPESHLVSPHCSLASASLEVKPHSHIAHSLSYFEPFHPIPSTEF